MCPYPKVWDMPDLKSNTLAEVAKYPRKRGCLARFAGLKEI